MYDSAGELLLPASRDEGSGFAQKEIPSKNQPSAAAAVAAAAPAAAAAALEAGSQRASSSGRRRPAKGIATGTASDVLRRSSADDTRSGDDRRATSVGARTAGDLRSRRKKAFSFNRGNGDGNDRDNGARLEQRRLGKGVEETNFLADDEHLGESRDAPGVIGRLRAKVAELELTAQVDGGDCCGVGDL